MFPKGIGIVVVYKWCCLVWLIGLLLVVYHSRLVLGALRQVLLILQLGLLHGLLVVKGVGHRLGFLLGRLEVLRARVVY